MKDKSTVHPKDHHSHHHHHHHHNEGLAAGLQVLAAQTLKIASINGLGEIDKLENDLEEEIRYENRSPAKTAIGRIRRVGHHQIHSKAVLLIVVFLNIIDCLLVISELVLDFLQVLLDREEVRKMVYEFIDKMEKMYKKEGWEEQYKDDPHGTDREYISYKFLQYVLNAFVSFKPTNTSSAAVQSRAEECVHFMNYTASSASQSLAGYVSATALNMGSDWSGGSKYEHGACFGPYVSSFSSSSKDGNYSSGYDDSGSYGYGYSNGKLKLKNHGYKDHSLLDVAHKLHYISIAILSVLVLLLFFKIFCSGKRFFRSRMQVFDGIIVLISFTLDLVFIEGFAKLGLQEFIIIIAFMLPWRILRVLNSLIAAVLDQQRLNLKIIYTQKKKISRTLSETNNKMEVMQRHIEVLQSLCTSRGLSVVNGEIVGTRTPNTKTKNNHGSSNHGHHKSSGGSSSGLGGLAGMMALGKLAFQAADVLSPLSNGFGSSDKDPKHDNNNTTKSDSGGGDGDITLKVPETPAAPLTNGHALAVSDDALNKGDHPSHEMGIELTPVGHLKAESDSDLVTLEHELQEKQQPHQREATEGSGDSTQLDTTTSTGADSGYIDNNGIVPRSSTRRPSDVVVDMERDATLNASSSTSPSEQSNTIKNFDPASVAIDVEETSLTEGDATNEAGISSNTGSPSAPSQHPSVDDTTNSNAASLPSTADSTNTTDLDASPDVSPESISEVPLTNILSGSNEEKDKNSNSSDAIYKL